MLLRLCLVWVCVSAVLAPQASAHPMPNTVIAIALDDSAARFDIAIPVAELRLALPDTIPAGADLLAEPQRTALITYLQAHCSVQSKSGATMRVAVQSIALSSARDENVGVYEEVRLQMAVEAGPGFDPSDFILVYDAVIHQVPTHFALVQIARDFGDGIIVGDRFADVGTIGFNFARNETPAFRISRTPAGLWKGFSAATSLGFAHVATGFDHWLFLVTLLVVAPLRSVEARWSLFQGWRYAARRFLAISLAFTLGHSVALLLGAYGLLAIPREAIEVFIAASILVAALHAIRPLFSGREWLVAAAFGIVHGLAFSESLGNVALTPWIKAFAVAGFNVGVEGAQLVAMACAVPLLAASRWRAFHALRVTAMVSAAVLAGAWMLERAHVIPGLDALPGA